MSQIANQILEKMKDDTEIFEISESEYVAAQTPAMGWYAVKRAALPEKVSDSIIAPDQAKRNENKNCTVGTIVKEPLCFEDPEQEMFREFFKVGDQIVFDVFAAWNAPLKPSHTVKEEILRRYIWVHLDDIKGKYETII